MRVHRFCWCVGLGMVLLLALSAVLDVSAADPRAISTRCGVASNWGQPCNPIHPSACYTGPEGQLARTEFGSAAPTTIMANTAPSAVQLICFFVEGGNAYVEIEWETASELETLGFHLLRSGNPEGPFQDISGFIPHCDDGGLVGGLYLFTDGQVQNGLSYYYRLQEVAGDQTYVYYPPLGEPPLVALPNLPTSTPTVTIPPTPTSTQSPSATPTATKTPSPTATDTPLPKSPTAPSGSPAATPTHTATATRTPTPSPTVMARTFTPTPAASEVATPEATPAVRPSPSTPAATASQPPAIGTSAGAAIPTMPSQAGGQVLDSPLATPPRAPSPTAYPPEGLATLPPTPLPTAYMPPLTRHVNQIATMTPLAAAGPETGPGASGGGPSPRIWLYTGFVGSTLILLVSLAVMLRRSQNPPRRPVESNVERTRSDDDQLS
jgi:hypothetical protein